MQLAAGEVVILIQLPPAVGAADNQSAIAVAAAAAADGW